MEDNLNILVKRRRPQYFGKWKTTSVLWQMDDDLNILELENNLNILENGRQPKYIRKLNSTLQFWQMEDDLNNLAERSSTQYIGKWKTTTTVWKM
jgi:hypothetical protein